MMKTQLIGQSALRVGRLGYGCMRISGSWDRTKVDAEATRRAIKAIETAYEAGYTLFDNADIYGETACESLFGEALRLHPYWREQMVIVTKCDGGVRVKNRGFLVEKNQWKEAESKAFFVNEKNEGYLKVSFFGPFYGSYIIFDLDKESYQYAFVSGPDTSYLWFLSRTPTVDQELMSRFVETSKELGFDTEKLIYVKHK